MTSLQAGKRALSLFASVIMAPTTFIKNKGCTIILHIFLLGILLPSVLVSGQNTSSTALPMLSNSSNASSMSTTMNYNMNYTTTATAVTNSTQLPTSMTSAATGNLTMTQLSNLTTTQSPMMTYSSIASNAATTATNVPTQLSTKPGNSTSGGMTSTQSANSTTPGSIMTTQSANTIISGAGTQSSGTMSASGSTSSSSSMTSAGTQSSGTMSASGSTSSSSSMTSAGTQSSGTMSASGSTSSSSSMTSGAASLNTGTASTNQASNPTGGMSGANGTTMSNSTSMSMIYCPSFMCNYSDCYTMYNSQNATQCDAYCQLKRELDMYYVVSCSAICAESCVNTSQINCSVNCCNSTGCLNNSFASMMMMTTNPVMPTTPTTKATTAATTTPTSQQTTENKGNKCHKGKCTGETCYKDFGKDPLQICSSSEPHCQLKKELMDSNVQWTAGCTTNCSKETQCKISAKPPCHLECCNATLTSCLWLNGTLNAPSSATRGPHLNTELPAYLLVLLAMALLL